MRKSSSPKTLATGLAMFSMFFGAGNIVFPLYAGIEAGDKTLYAILGLLITAVAVPFMGLMAIMLFDGNREEFFNRVGRGYGFGISILIMLLLGPMGALPRTITLSYSTIHLFVPSLNMYLFNGIACVLIYLFTVRKRRILDLIGYVFTPILLLSLLVIVIMGCITEGSAVPNPTSSGKVFYKGFITGYFTLDLLASFFFATVILANQEQQSGVGATRQQKAWQFFKSSCIGATLLGLVYTGFSFIASWHAHDLHAAGPEELLGAIAFKMLGQSAGTISSIAVAFTCITTAIALAAVSADYIRKDLLGGRISYRRSLIISLILAFIFANMGFSGIAKLIAPLLEICYPALITLAVLNVFHKLFNLQPVKIPVLVIFILTVILKI